MAACRDLEGIRLSRGGNKVLSPRERSEVYGKEKAINFYGRKLSLAWAKCLLDAELAKYNHFTS